MTYDQIVSTVMSRLGNRPTLRPLIETELELAVTMELERDPQFKPWFLLTNTLQAAVTVADQDYIALPTNFLAEHEDNFLWVEDPTDSNRLKIVKKNTYDVLKERHKNATGQPRHYAILNDRAYLFPRPDAVYNLKQLYYQSQGITKDNDSNPWITYAADWLIAATTMAVAESIQNLDAVRVATIKMQRARNRVQAETEERHEININTLMGDL